MAQVAKSSTRRLVGALLLLSFAFLAILTVFEPPRLSLFGQVHVITEAAILLAIVAASELYLSRIPKPLRMQPPPSFAFAFATALVFVAPSIFSVVALVLVSLVVGLILQKQPISLALDTLAISVIFGSMASILSQYSKIYSEATSAIALQHSGVVVGAILFATAIHVLLRAFFFAIVRERNVTSALKEAANVAAVGDLLLLTVGTLIAYQLSESTTFALLLLFIGFVVTHMVSSATIDRMLQSIDPGTGLYSRPHFESLVVDQMGSGSSRKNLITLLMLQIDGVSAVENSLGSQMAIGMVRSAALKVERVSRPQSIVASFGGGTFAIALFNKLAGDELLAYAEEVVHEIGVNIDVGGVPLACGANIGAASYPNDADNLVELIRRADYALYKAQRQKSSFVSYSSDGDLPRPGRLALLGDLKDAIGTDQLFLAYQPKLSLQDGSVGGLEALIRWRHPKLGMISPGEFMPVAEQTDLMIPLTEWVIESALLQLSKWHAAGIKVAVAVNASARNLHDLSFASRVDEAIRRSGIDSRWLEVEITESSVMADRSRSILTIERLREIGVQISVDDFGTGYSSFDYLKNLPINTIKIDSSYVTSMMNNERMRIIVKAIVNLARDLGLKTVAEGVETLDVLEDLGEIGCDMAQGFYISRPAPAAEITNWMMIDRANRIAPVNFIPRQVS
ncbi:MAG: bifunctional diguanylate cyclase/phosphodiesterase [Actinomycetota bacterium]|nr:bifunctional diguanylate cyclase/phosphodiesterase [Actinomycetota bacterium]